MNHESPREPQVEDRRLDDLVGDIPIKLTKEELLELSRLSPARSCLHIAGEWLLILSAIFICQRSWNPLLYLVAVAFIAARQHALLALMHDAVHYRLYRTRWLNDWVGEVLLAWPNLVAMRSYRRNHLAHHRYLNTDQDPDWLRRQGNADWVFPKNWRDLARLLLRDAAGLGAIPLIRLAASFSSKDPEASRGFVLARLAFYLAAVMLIVWLGALKLVLLYWFVPFFTWLITIMHLRSIAEHSAIEGRERAYAQTRTTRPCLIERIFIAPKNIHYHLEHHFFPSVPFYRLPKLHGLLQSKPEFRSSAHVTRTYWGVLRECAGRTELGAAARPEREPGRVAIEGSFASGAS